MGSVLIQLLPLVIGSMLMPTWIMLVVSLLRLSTEIGAVAFVGGVTTVRLLQGVIFGAVTVAYTTRQTSSVRNYHRLNSPAGRRHSDVGDRA